MGSLKLLWSESNELMRNRLTSVENVGGHGSGCNRAIRVMDLIDVGDVRDVGDVCYVPNVRDVDYAKVVAAVVIPREVWLARPQWKPSCQADIPHANANREVWSSNEGNQGRGIDWKRDVRAWQPAPSWADQDPTAVVEGTEAPRLIFHPCPAPGLDPRPVAKTIRHPSDRNACGIPDRPIFFDHFPAPVII